MIIHIVSNKKQLPKQLSNAAMLFVPKITIVIMNYNETKISLSLPYSSLLIYFGYYYFHIFKIKHFPPSFIGKRCLILSYLIFLLLFYSICAFYKRRKRMKLNAYLLRSWSSQTMTFAASKYSNLRRKMRPFAF